MKEIYIEHLGYLLKQAKAKSKPQPIFFLGAGASRSGKIPLASEIVRQILDEYSDSPFVKDLPSEQRTYSKLLGCLLPNQRDELLKKIIDKAKINVTHIYLAQLMNEGYVDYVLTVNFDNLMLRALALYNIFPSTYDMAILKDLTTTTFKVKSVVYLHGQHHGLWLLNTPEEMAKVKDTVPRIFDTIKNQRPWVFIGYSGDDPIFEHVKNLGRFDNGLYWVTFKDTVPNENIQKFLTNPDTNAFVIKGYDSDSFMVKLNNELNLSQPVIVDKPFTALKNMLEEIVDIDEQEHFKGVKERLDIAKRQVEYAIDKFEHGAIKTEKNIIINQDDYLKKEIINLIISEKYEEATISEIAEKIKKNSDNEAKKLFAILYLNWGNSIGDIAKTKDGVEAESLYQQSFEKFHKAIEIKPDFQDAYCNWGAFIGTLARSKDGIEADALYQQSFEKYSKAIEINPDFEVPYFNWGLDLGHMAKTKNGIEAENLYQQSFEKFSKAIELKPDFIDAYNIWGIVLIKLANSKDRIEAEVLYKQSFEKFNKVIEIKPDYHSAYFNWGFSLGCLAKTKNGIEAENLYQQSFEKFSKAIELKPDYHEAYFNWGTNLGLLTKTKDGIEAEKLYQQSFEKFSKAIKLKPDYHEAYFNWGTNLGLLAKTKDGIEAENLYQQSFEKFSKVIELKPDSHEAYFNWGLVLGDLAKTKDEIEAENLYQQSFEKFSKVIELKPDSHEAYSNWGIYLKNLAKTKDGIEAEKLYQQSFEKLRKAIDNGGYYYNIACLFAVRGNKKEALHYLELSLTKSEIELNYMLKDDDWKNYLNNKEFIKILNKFRLKGTKA